MRPELQAKYEKLIAILQRGGRAAVAFSGGVDSTFLMKAAQEALGEDCLAVTIVSTLLPESEKGDAEAFCRSQGIRQTLVHADVFRIDGFAENPPDRCYICKKYLFKRAMQAAEDFGAKSVYEGSNMDDTGDYRPGMRAVKELGVRSPLMEAELTKAEIRELSKELGLPTWNRPSKACLASRFAYGERINEKKIRMVDAAEEYLMGLGFVYMRVRMHGGIELNAGTSGEGMPAAGSIARIELMPEDMPRFMQDDIRSAVEEKLREIGFSYVTLDLRGYRVGSMNEVLMKN